MAESDYKPLKDFEVVWDDGDVEDRHLSIGLVDDDFHEGDEHFYLVITDPHPECGAEFAIGMVRASHLNSQRCYGIAGSVAANPTADGASLMLTK